MIKSMIFNCRGNGENKITFPKLDISEIQFLKNLTFSALGDDSYDVYSL